MKKFPQIFLALFTIGTLQAQIGINTASPDPSSILDIQSSTKGLLIPRLDATERDAITNPANGLLLFNTDTNNLQSNTGTSASPTWSTINNTPSVSSDTDNEITTGTDGGAYLGRSVYMGKFVISASGTVTISGLPFEPTQIKFTAHANVETYNLDSDNGVGNNNNTIANAFGSMSGYATNYNSTLSQQVIYIGGSGSSINDISRFASSGHCIGIRYSNNNGYGLGVTSANVTSFNADGFTLDVDSHDDDLVILFEAYR